MSDKEIQSGSETESSQPHELSAEEREAVDHELTTLLRELAAQANKEADQLGEKLGLNIQEVSILLEDLDLKNRKINL